MPKRFYCLTFGQNMVSLFIYLLILNMWIVFVVHAYFRPDLEYANTSRKHMRRGYIILVHVRREC
jgi:hypothetical protein